MDFQLSDYQRDLVAITRDFARAKFGPQAFTWEARDVFPREYLALLAGQGLAGIAMAEADGGQGATLLDAVLVIETIAQVCPTAGDCVQALNFGAVQQLAHYGSPLLKERFLGPCLRGERVISIAMSEPDAGSAVTDLRTRARLDGDEAVLNGQKLFTTNGDHADFFVVWVKFGAGSRSSGAVVVERGAPGFTIDGSHKFMSGEHYGMLYF